MIEKINNNHNFDELFAEYLEEQKKSLSSVNNKSSYYSSYYSSRFTVYFYEWSNINSSPRQFSSSEIFLKFLNDCQITLSDYQRNRITSGYWFYASCVPGKRELILCDTYSDLRSRLLAGR